MARCNDCEYGHNRSVCHMTGFKTSDIDHSCSMFKKHKKRKQYRCMTNKEYIKRCGLKWSFCPVTYGLDTNCSEIMRCEECLNSPAVRNGKYLLVEAKEDK